MLFQWCGYLGAALLVAGPAWQATVELRHLIVAEVERGATVREPGALWWLLPWAPYLEIRRALAPSPTTRRVFAVASGWLTVSTGALLVVVKEAHELVEHAGWPSATTALLVLGVVVFGQLNAVVRGRALAGGRRD